MSTLVPIANSVGVLFFLFTRMTQWQESHRLSTFGGSGEEGMSVNVISDLPEGEPQGTFVIRISPTATGRDLMRLVCKEARVPLSSDYGLRSAEGALVSLDTQLHNYSSIQEGKSMQWVLLSGVTGAGHKCWNIQWLFGIISMLIGVVGLITVAIVYTRAIDNTQYAVIFDAGSSHTSMFIYKWEGSMTNLTALAIQDGARCDTEAGISTFEDNPSKAGQSLVKCLNSAADRIPDKQHGETPIYLGATAGMRLLQVKNPNASNAIIDSVRNTISTYPFQFLLPERQARIITGLDEGSFAWISSNYISGTFHVHPPADGVFPESIVPSVGAMDLGGASTQMSFTPKGPFIPYGYGFDSWLFGNPYRAYVHSYLCYGVNEAATRLQAVLIRDSNFSSTVKNPCAPRNNVMKVNHSNIFSSPCVKGSDADATFGHSISPGHAVDKDTVYTLQGESNATECRDLIVNHLFNFSAKCDYNSCSFNGVFQPPVYGDFYAFSSYFYVMDFLNVTNSNTSVSYDQFTEASESLCGKDWQHVKDMKTHRPQNLPWYCFESQYIDVLLVQGYKFEPTSTWKSIHFTDSLIGMEVGWTLGFVLFESHNFPQVTKDYSTVAIVLISVLFGAFIVLALLFMARAWRQRRVPRRSSFRGNTYGAI